MPSPDKTTWTKFLSRDELGKESKMRKVDFYECKIGKDQIEAKKEEGWSVLQEYKASFKVRKQKPIGDKLEDEVWSILWQLGADYLNEGRKFIINYGADEYSTKQIDVICIIEDVCICVECKATKERKNKSWKTDIESINSYKNKVFNKIQEHFGEKKLKFKYIFATSNYILSANDRGRLKEFDIFYLNEDSIKYFKTLADDLRSAAKYQILGYLFEGEKIKDENILIPALKSKMGEEEYYSFCITPAQLLKIGFVLHRLSANENKMPTYQRLISSKRLKSIRRFVNSGNYFPNSIIISLESDELEFYPAELRGNTSMVSAGILSIPQKYLSAFIIDGQHRLYGYSDTERMNIDAIPVVAFINLPKQEQLSMFMDINEKQTKVSNSLRNVLSISMLWGSDVAKERNESLAVFIADKLGCDPESSLYKMVLTGENKETKDTYLSLEYMKTAILRGCFLNNKSSKRESEVVGLFDKGNNDESSEFLYPFIRECLNTVAERCKEEKEKRRDGFLFTNNGIYAILRIVSNIVEITYGKSRWDNNSTWKEIYDRCLPLLNSFTEACNTLAPEKRKEIHDKKGDAAKNASWRILQQHFNLVNSEFKTPDFEKWMEEEGTDYSPDASEKVLAIYDYIIGKTKEAFLTNPNWFKEYFPLSVRESILLKQASAEARGEEVPEIWNLVTFKDIMSIATFHRNWSEHFKSFLSLQTNSSKQNTLEWLDTLHEIKSRLKDAKKINKAQYDKIIEIYNQLFQDHDTNS